MRAHEFLREAGQALEQRAALRDQPTGERSMARAVKIFEAWTGIELSELDGWRFMVALKQAREIQGNFCADDYTDGSGYFGLVGECAASAKGEAMAREAQP
jgi:antirestriction protein